MKMRNLFLFLVITTVTIKALALNCKNAALESSESHTIQGVPFWMTSGGDYISYNTTNPFRAVSYDMKLRKNEVIHPKRIDAAPLAAGDLYVLPQPIQFFRKKDGANAKPVFTDNSIEGDYQSIGQLSEDGPNRVIRMFVGTGTGVVRDYKITQNNNDYTVTPLGPKVPLCQKASGKKGLSMQTPVLSRDGKMVAARDSQTNVTKIWKLEMPSGQCTEMMSLREETSKVSFSFDHKKILYSVVDKRSLTFSRLIEMDLATGQKRTLTGPGEKVLYQTYRADGAILYARENKKNESDLIAIKPNLLPVLNSPLTKDFTALGHAWAKLCNYDPGLDNDQALAVGARLKKSDCLVAADFLITNTKNLETANINQLCTSRGASTGSDQDRENTR